MNIFETCGFFTTGSAQITCYTVSSVDGEFNCEPTTDNFQAGTIEECCVENIGHFFEEGEDNACQACIGMERNKYRGLHNCVRNIKIVLEREYIL